MANPDKMVMIGGQNFRMEEDGAWIQMDLAHERIHLGHIHTASTYASALANGGTALINIRSAAVQPHFIFRAFAAGNSVIQIVEGGTVAGTSELLVYNRNRGAAGVPVSAVSQGGTPSGGTVIYYQFIPGGSGGGKVGGAGRADSEFVGKTSTWYSIGVVNGSGNTSATSVEIDFYEVSEV